MIYTITAYCPPEEHRIPESRVFGYYHWLCDAEAAVFANRADMHEGLYTHVVIEAVPPGVHALAEVREWFRWVPEGWIVCEPPEWASAVRNHSMG